MILIFVSKVFVFHGLDLYTGRNLAHLLLYTS
jgi:hypothetical protein